MQSQSNFQFKNYTSCSHGEQSRILQCRNDTVIRKWMSNSEPIKKEDHLNFIESLKSNTKQKYYAVFYEGIYIATINIHYTTDEICERGIYIIPEYQGKGLTKMMELAFLSELIKSGVKKVTAKVKLDNIRSIKYHEKMGYKETHRDEEYIYYEISSDMIEKVNRGGYNSHGFEFKDFITLTSEEKKMVLEWRNTESVRKWMYNKDVISLENHLGFIESLKNREDRYYWLVTSPKGNYIGVLNVTEVNREKDQAEMGLYLNPQSNEFGFDFVRECFYFFFNTLQCKHLYCAVDSKNMDAYSIDSFLGCEFDEKKYDGETCYLVSNNLTRDRMNERYKLKFSDYLKFCKNSSYGK